MRFLALALMLLTPLAPAAAYDWTPNNYILTGPVFPNCHVGLGRVWRDDGPTPSPIHVRMRNNNTYTTRFAWQVELVTPSGAHFSAGSGVVTIAPFNWGVADSLPVNPWDVNGSRLVVTINACTPG